MKKLMFLSFVFVAIISNAQLKVLSSGYVGAKNTNPLSAFQVNDTYVKTAFGSANTSGLNWGTSYIGFNAVRQSMEHGCPVEMDQHPMVEVLFMEH